MTTSVLQDMIRERTGQPTFGAEAPASSSSMIPTLLTAGIVLAGAYIVIGREYSQGAKERGERLYGPREGWNR